MIQVSIKNKQSQVVTNQASFNTMDEANAWIAECEKVEAFGKPSKWVEPEPVVMENGSIISGAGYIELAEYDIIIDETYVDQTAINAEALSYLASTDWLVIRQQETGVEMPIDIFIKRQEARNKIKR